jgi:hypothetical protein
VFDETDLLRGDRQQRARPDQVIGRRVLIEGDQQGLGQRGLGAGGRGRDRRTTG